MSTTILRKIAGPVLGAGGGYLVFKWITCRGGGWNITGNPILMIAFGAFIGWSLLSGGEKKTDDSIDQW